MLADADFPKKINDEWPAGAMEARCVDGSVVKVHVLDELIEVDTVYGKMLVPVADIRFIQFAVRISAKERKRTDAAIADLDHTDAARRDAAVAELLSLREKSYSALLAAAKSKHADAARRAETVLDALRKMVPTEKLESAQLDVVHTARSTIVGHIRAESLRVDTFAFGERHVKLADLQSLHGQTVRPAPTGK